MPRTRSRAHALALVAGMSIGITGCAGAGGGAITVLMVGNLFLGAVA